uniref:CCHC-type domain-containing protein n=1 Tax=Tanacetum cinerariifolium TaxID=118510 RepID=A0A6L2L875_TANCI|nr:hypothetical protein [Tanacetum cinerariifolium]
MIKDTDLTGWDEIWYVSNQIDRHVCYNLDAFCNVKEGFSVTKLESQKKFLFTYGMGEILIEANGKSHIIPGVYYAPEVTLNILSLELLEKQGFQVNYDGNRCNLSLMFRDKEIKRFDEDGLRRMQNQYLQEYFKSITKEGEGLEQDTVRIKGNLYSTKRKDWGTLRREQQLDFIQRKLKKENQEQIGSCMRKISEECKSMLKNKMKEVIQYNTTLNQPTSNNRFKNYKCFQCKQVGHIVKSCPMDYKVENSDANKETKIRMEGIKAIKPSVLITYPETIHFSTTCMIKDTDLTGWDEICQKKFLFTYGMGEILIEANGKSHIIPGVYYAPEVTLNILSLELLEKQEKDRECLGSHQWEISKNGAQKRKPAVLKGKKIMKHFDVQLEDTTKSPEEPTQAPSSPPCIDMMCERGISSNIATYNPIIDAHCLMGEMDKARSLFNSMVSSHVAPDTTTYNSLLIGYCDDEKMDDAMLNDTMLVYHEMNEKGFKPNWVTSNIMIRSCFKAARFADAHTLLDELFAQGQTLGQVTYSKILHDLFLHYRFKEAFSMFHLLGDDSKVNSHLYIVHDLMYGAIRCGKLDIARELFEGLSVKRLKPTSLVYTTMIGGFCAEGLLNDAKQLFLEMEENFCLPTDNTYNFLLQGYLKNKCYNVVEMLLHKMEERDHYLYYLTLSLQHESVAAGSLDTSI